jgi:hypothetical protein
MKHAIFSLLALCLNQLHYRDSLKAMDNTQNIQAFFKQAFVTNV